MKAGWEESAAQEITRRAARLSAAPPTGARARVWRALEARRSQERDRPARRRLGWAMFTAGAACAAAIAVVVVPRGRSTELTIQASAEAATIDLGLQKSGGVWRINSFRVNSDILIENKAGRRT